MRKPIINGDWHGRKGSSTGSNVGQIALDNLDEEFGLFGIGRVKWWRSSADAGWWQQRGGSECGRSSNRMSRDDCRELGSMTWEELRRWGR
jgi:hypothetical protein